MRYIMKTPVEAVQIKMRMNLNGERQLTLSEDIPDWLAKAMLNKDVRPISRQLMYNIRTASSRTPTGWQFAHPGDWIVCKNNELFVFSDNDFNKFFELA